MYSLLLHSNYTYTAAKRGIPIIVLWGYPFKSDNLCLGQLQVNLFQYLTFPLLRIENIEAFSERGGSIVATTML